MVSFDQVFGLLLEPLDDVLAACWREVTARRGLFEAANAAGHHVRSLADYRRQVGALPALVLAIDDLAPFIWDADFDVSCREDGTTAHRLKRLLAEAGSLGIHVIIASQIYSDVDVPKPLRWLLGNVLVFRLNPDDVTRVGLPEAASLKPGEYLVAAQWAAMAQDGKRTGDKASIPEFNAPRKLFGRLPKRR